MTRIERMLRSTFFRRAGLLLASVATAAVFFILGVLFRVFMGPVSLGPLNTELRGALREQLPGLQLKFDEAALEWSADEGRINLVIFGTRVFDRSDRIIAQAPEAELGLASAEFLAGKIVIRRITLVGVQLTLVHTNSGALQLGVERGSGQSDILKVIRDAVARSSHTGAPALRSFAIRRARLAFYDEETGAFVVAPEAELQLTEARPGDKNSPINAAIDARIEISGRGAHLVATIAFPRKSGALKGDFSLTRLSLGALAVNARKFAFLRPFALDADISGSFNLLHGTDLQSLDIGVGAQGVVSGFGPPLHLRSIRLVARYDGRTHRVLIDDGTVTGEHVSVHLTGTDDLTFDPNGSLSGAAFVLTVDKLAANMPGILSQSVSFARAYLRGTYAPAIRQVALDQATIVGGPLSATFSGRIGLVDGKSPAIAVEGKVNPISVRDMLRYWPLGMGPGARNWIDRNVSAGRIGSILVRTNIAAGALDQPSLPEDAMSVSFPVTGATVSYIRGLMPLTGVTGTALLSGDTFKAEISSGSVGNITLTPAKVTVPNLHMHGMTGDVTAHAEGSLPDVLALIDMKPLQYPSRFHINPAATGGRTAIDLDFHIPMVRNLSVDRIGMAINGTISGLTLPLGPHTKISGGMASVAVDNSRLHASGQVTIGNTGLAVDWLESFKPAPITTHVMVRGTLDDTARAAFNLHTENILSGPMTVVADLEGYRGAIQRAKIDADLTPAVLAVDLVNIRKPAGGPATAQVSAGLDQKGNLQSADVSVAGGSLSARGNAVFGPSGDLQRLELASVRDGGLNDFSLAMSESPVTGLNLLITGHSADGTAIGHKSAKTMGANKQPVADSGEPFHVNARLDRLTLRDGVNMAPFALDVSGIGPRPRTLALSAMLSKSAQVTASVASSDAGRSVTIASNDAGLLLKGLFGFTSIRGGQLSVTAAMPPIGRSTKKDDPDYTGQAVVRDCTVVNQMFLTRIFSSGSLEGFVDLMRGQGIAIDTLQVPFRVTGDVIDIHDARASGPSIGVTTDGYVDRANNQLALQGAIAPLYGINGVLGSIPVLGNVFVSKKGEGVFGVTYSATGNADEPQVVVNPLAMLAPGIFRRIFEGAAPSAPSALANSTPKKPQ